MMHLPQASLKMLERKLGRRSFLKTGVLVFSGCIFPQTAFAAIREIHSPERSLSLHNLHTGESLKAVYWSQGRYLPEALAEINYILRDHRTDEMRSIDRRLLDLLYALNEKLNSQQPLHIISGYRSPSTNARLRKAGCAVAKKSLHLQGKAADIRMPGCELSSLRQMAMQLKAGGVGYYPRSHFVHVDVGRPRCW